MVQTTFRSNAIGPAPAVEEATHSQRLTSAVKDKAERVLSVGATVLATSVSDSAEHPISQMVFTAVTVGLISCIFCYAQSLKSISDLTLIPLEEGTGGLSKRHGL